MPTYEYKCPNGHLFEKTFPRISNQRFAKCPKCGKRSERQISGGAGLVFKGSGFYATDYKRPAGTTEKADKRGGKAGKHRKSDPHPRPKNDSHPNTIRL